MRYEISETHTYAYNFKKEKMDNQDIINQIAIESSCPSLSINATIQNGELIFGPLRHKIHLADPQLIEKVREHLLVTVPKRFAILTHLPIDKNE